MRSYLLFIAFPIAIGILLIFTSSCKPKTDYSKEISRLDSAEVKLKEVQNLFLSLDTNALRSSYNSAEEKLHFIYTKIAGDTVKKKTAIFLSDAYEQLGNIFNLMNNKKYFDQAIREGQQRVSDLKHDLKEDLIENNKSGEYVVNEANASQKIYEAVSRTVEKAKASVLKLDSLKTQLTFLTDSLSK